MQSSAATRRARSRVALSTRYKGAGHPATIDARRDLAAAQIADDIARRLEAAPPLTDEQADRLAALLRNERL